MSIAIWWPSTVWGDEREQRATGQHRATWPAAADPDPLRCHPCPTPPRGRYDPSARRPHSRAQNQQPAPEGAGRPGHMAADLSHNAWHSVTNLSHLPPASCLELTPSLVPGPWLPIHLADLGMCQPLYSCELIPCDKYLYINSINSFMCVCLLLALFLWRTLIQTPQKSKLMWPIVQGGDSR